MQERNGKNMIPCLSLEDAISQTVDADERKELEFQCRCLVNYSHLTPTAFEVGACKSEMHRS